MAHRLDTRLVSLATLKAYLTATGAKFADSTHDTLLTSCVRRASMAVSSYCRRQFEAHVHTLQLDGSGDTTLYLPHWPIAKPEPTLTLAFTSGGATRIEQGDTITGATGGATATVCGVGWLTSGTSWADEDAAGTLYLASQTGTFEAEELNTGNGNALATIASDSSAVSASHGVWIDSSYTFASTAKLTEQVSGTSGSYAIVPDSDSWGRLVRLYSVWTRGTMNIQVRMLLGYDEPPDDVTQAVCRVSAKMYEEATQGPHGHDQQPIAPDGGSISIATRQALPDDVKQLLVMYARRDI